MTAAESAASAAIWDTIAAIATAPGTGAIGMIRVSGPQAFAVADRLSRPKRPVSTQAGYTLRRVNHP